MQLRTVPMCKVDVLLIVHKAATREWVGVDLHWINIHLCDTSLLTAGHCPLFLYCYRTQMNNDQRSHHYFISTSASSQACNRLLDILFTSTRTYTIELGSVDRISVDILKKLSSEWNGQSIDVSTSMGQRREILTATLPLVLHNNCSLFSFLFYHRLNWRPFRPD